MRLSRQVPYSVICCVLAWPPRSRVNSRSSSTCGTACFDGARLASPGPANGAAAGRRSGCCRWDWRCPCPAISGAEPWIGSYRPRLPLAQRRRRQQAQRAGQHRGFVGEDVAEQVLGDQHVVVGAGGSAAAWPSNRPAGARVCTSGIIGWRPTARSRRHRREVSSTLALSIEVTLLRRLLRQLEGRAQRRARSRPRYSGIRRWRCRRRAVLACRNSCRRSVRARTRRSTPARRSALTGESCAVRGCTRTGRRLANTPSAARNCSRPCSGRTLAFGSDHLRTADRAQQDRIGGQAGIARRPAGSASPWRRWRSRRCMFAECELVRVMPWRRRCNTCDRGGGHFRTDAVTGQQDDARFHAAPRGSASKASMAAAA